jgi:hypothetical protein
MSLESDVVNSTVTTKLPKYKLLPKAREQLLDEFQLNERTLKLIDNQLSQEPYNMVAGRDGRSKPSTRWVTTIEKIWTWNCAIPDEKDRKHFKPSMTLKGETFYRRDIIAEPVFRADLYNSIRRQIKGLGYNRCYNKVVWCTDYSSNEDYETMLIQVPVGR